MLNKKDLLVLSSLRKNARMTLTKMSRNIQIPISSIYDNIKGHEGNLIQKHTSLIDFSKIGFNTRATVLLKVKREEREQVKEYLIKNQHINTAHKINSGWDFMFEGIFRHIKDLEEFLEVLEDKFKVKQRQVYYIIEDIKREEFMADPNLVEVFQ